MLTFRSTLEYQGSDFSGWQRQPERRTVQGELERALALLCRTPVAVTAAGRTDAGVHATGQVVSFRLESLPWGRGPEPFASDLAYRLNRLLPDDIAIRELCPAAPGFHARHDALIRSYRYSIRHRRHPLSRHLSWLVRYELDLAQMNETVSIIKKYEDFKAFTRAELELPSFRVDLGRLDLFAVEEGLDIVVSARRFLHNMIRILAGTLVDVGRGHLSPAQVEQALRARDRRLAGPTAPAHGLCFERVDYPGEGASPAPRRNTSTQSP